MNFSSHPAFFEFYRWISTDPNINYPAGSPPIIDLHNPSEIDTFIASYRKPVNNQEFIKKGLEYVLDLGEIKELKTDIHVLGAYMLTRAITNSDTYTLPYGNGEEQLPWVGVYPAGEGTELQRFNTNLIAVTHIPKIRL